MATFRTVKPRLLWIVAFHAMFTTGFGIRGGVTAEYGHNPWQAALINDSSIIFCGGSLIHPEYILTASHCVFGYSPGAMFVRMGGHESRPDRDQYPYRDFAIEKIIMHPLYQRSRNMTDDDIALIRLSERVELRPHISTIDLPARNASFEGRAARVSGWGDTKIDDSHVVQPAKLRELNVEVIKCEWSFKYFPTLRAKLVFASATKGNGVCDGDSGGPLSVDTNGKRELIGVVRTTMTSIGFTSTWSFALDIMQAILISSEFGRIPHPWL